MKNKKSVVLLSAGLDSTVNLYMSAKSTEVVKAITFDYGQRAAESEIKAASSLCQDLKIDHEVMKIEWLKKLSSSSLTSDSSSVPVKGEVDINSLDQSKKTAKSVWVPNRNGLFLNIAAVYAETLKADFVVPGFNVEEAATFPDNSEDFMKAQTGAFKFSTSNQVQVQCWTVKMNKKEIVQEGIKLNVPYHKIWPCYFSGEAWCGECESCQRTLRALKENNLIDQANLKRS